MNRNTAHEIRTNDERLKRTSGRLIRGLGALSTGLVFMGIGALAPGPALAYLAGGAALGRMMTAGPLPDRSVQQMSAVLGRVGDKISVSTEYGARFLSRSRKRGSVAVKAAIGRVRLSASSGESKKSKPNNVHGNAGSPVSATKKLERANNNTITATEGDVNQVSGGAVAVMDAQINQALRGGNNAELAVSGTEELVGRFRQELDGFGGFEE